MSALPRVVPLFVAGQLPQQEHNATLHLLSASAQVWRYGVAHYEQRSPDTSTLILELLKGFQSEGINMSYTLEDFRRDFIKDYLKDLTPAERKEALKSLPADEIISVLPAEVLQRLREQLGNGGTSAQLKKRRRK